MSISTIFHLNWNWHNAFIIPQTQREKVIKCHIEHRLSIPVASFYSVFSHSDFFFFFFLRCRVVIQVKAALPTLVWMRIQRKRFIKLLTERCTVIKHKWSFLKPDAQFYKVTNVWSWIDVTCCKSRETYLAAGCEDVVGRLEALYLILIRSKARRPDLSNNLQRHHHKDLARTSLSGPDWLQRRSLSVVERRDFWVPFLISGIRLQPSLGNFRTCPSASGAFRPSVMSVEVRTRMEVTVEPCCCDCSILELSDGKWCQIGKKSKPQGYVWTQGNKRRMLQEE